MAAFPISHAQQAVLEQGFRRHLFKILLKTFKSLNFNIGNTRFKNII